MAAAPSRWCPFGYGDGGGGPTREMLAAAHRTADLEGSPKVRLGSPRSFFARAEAEYPALPVWVGEMYLELHRGTYTSQARTKQGNRRSEHLLREAELWCATAARPHGVRLPGGRAEAALAAGAAAAVPRHPAGQLHRLGAPGRRTQLRRRRPRSWKRSSARRPAALLGRGRRGRSCSTPRPHERHGVPALGARPSRPSTGGSLSGLTEVGGGFVLDNGIIRVVVDARRAADVPASTTRPGREAIAPGQCGNLLELHRDTPNEWDAWDIDEHLPPATSSIPTRRDVDRASAPSIGHGSPSVVVQRLGGSSPVTAADHAGPRAPASLAIATDRRLARAAEAAQARLSA